MIGGDSLEPSIVHLYGRVSSEEQVDQGTIENQLDRWRKWCDLHGHTPGRVFLDEAVSGTVPFNERKAGAELLQEAHDGSLKGTVCIVKLDRIGRTVSVVLRAVADLEAAGIRITSVMEPFDTGSPWGRFALNILATFAEFERDSILWRSREGTRRRAAEGVWLGGKPPFGYVAENGRLVRDTRWIEQAGETVSDLAIRIFKELGENEGTCFGVAVRFNRLGIPPPEVWNGRTLWKGPNPQWHTGSVARILSNPTYKGIQRFGRKGTGGVANPPETIITTACLALVSPELWEAAQKQMHRAKGRGPRGRAKRQYLLSGMIFCGTCGHTYGGLTMKGMEEKAEATDNEQGTRYRCQTRASQAFRKKQCDSPNISGAIERQTWDRVIAWLSSDPEEAIIAGYSEIEEGTERQQIDRETAEAEIGACLKTLAGFQTQRDSLMSLYRRGIITEPELLRQLADIDAETAVTRGELKKAESKKAKTTQSAEAKKRANELRENLASLANASDWETKRQVIEAVIDRLVVHHEAGKVRIEIQWRA